MSTDTPDRDIPDPTDTDSDLFADIDLSREHLKNKLFLGIIFAASMFGVVMLFLLLADVTTDFYVGITEYNISLVEFFTNDGSRRAELSGFKGAIIASIMLMMLAAALSFFVGVGSAIYLEEYAPDNRITRLIEANLSNLAGVPSIVYGLLALAAFVNGIGMGQSAGWRARTWPAIMPIIIVSPRKRFERPRQRPQRLAGDWGDQMADNPAGRPAGSDARYSHRNNSRTRPRDRRDRAPVDGWRAVCQPNAKRYLRPLQRDANPDLRLGCRAKPSLYSSRRSRHRRSTGVFADDERGCDLSAE